ncbi:10634_t:CDS:2, partial [Funneliformis geosporum]
IYTRKEKGINYKVPNNYQVKTTLSGLTVLCKTQYQFSRKIAIKYIIEWTDENDQIKSRYSLSSARAAGSLFLKPNSQVAGTILFGLDINFLQQMRENIAQQSIISANRKRYFTELTSQSQKNKHITMVGKEIAAQTLTILKNNKFTTPSEEII